MTARLQVDNSVLRALATCHTQALLRYHMHLESPEPRAELAAGTAWHKALEAWFDETEVPMGHALGTWLREYQPEEVFTGFRARLAKANLTAIVSAWLNGHTKASFPLQVTATEQPFCVKLTDDIEYVGIFDGLGTDTDGRPWILEHKSTGRLTEDWWGGFDLDSQLSGYVWAAREMGQTWPIYAELAATAGAYVNAIEFSQLPSDPVRTCATHKQKYAQCGPQHASWAIRPITRTAEQLHQWKETAIRLARIWQEIVETTELSGLGWSQQQGMWTGACKWCQFADYCKMGRPQEFLKTYTVNEWRPLNRGKT